MFETIDATRSLEPPIRCVGCGQFIGYADIDAGLCRFDFEPDSHFGPEVADWSCPKCSEQERAGGA